MDSSADFKWSLLGARRAHQHRQAEPRRDPNRGTRPGGGRVCRARRPAITVGSFVATSGQKPWPSAGSFVAAYGQFFMAADIPARLFVGDLLLPEPVPVAHGVAVAPTETPPVDLEGTAPRLLPRNRVHREIEWLRRGPKARTSKSKARIDKANQLIGELVDLNARTRTATAGIDFSATDRKTRRLIELENVTFAIGGRTLFQDLNFILTAGMRVGLVGPNGSGKTTLLRLLSREIAPTAGEIRTADSLQIVSVSYTHLRAH